jgi:hypothetical protein
VNRLKALGALWLTQRSPLALRVMTSAPSSVSEDRLRLMNPSVVISLHDPSVTGTQQSFILETRILLPKIGLKHFVAMFVFLPSSAGLR